MRLSAVRLFVHELAPARRFYEGVLGLPLRREGPGWCVFALAASGGAADPAAPALVLESVSPEAPEDEQALVGRFSGVSFAVADIQVAFRQLQAGGVFFTGAPERQAWGGWLATFEDPAGNRLQIVQHPVAG